MRGGLLFFWSSHTCDLNVGATVAALSGVWRYTVRLRTSCPGVRIVRLGEIASSILNFCLTSPSAKCVVKQVSKDRQKDIQTDRRTKRQTDKHSDRHLDRHSDRQTFRQTDIQPDRHSDRQTDIEKFRQTFRQTHKLEENFIHTWCPLFSNNMSESHLCKTKKKEKEKMKQVFRKSTQAQAIVGYCP